MNASRCLRSIAARTCARRILFGWPLAPGTSRSFAGNASLSSLANGRHNIIHDKSTRFCYRQIHNKPNGSTSSTFRERLSDLRRNGTPEIIFGSIILALVGIDYVLQIRNDDQREDMYRQLEREVRGDEATTIKEDRKMVNEGVATKSIFKCIIRKVPENFDGHKSLKNVKVGDVVGVIEEGVGPDGQYNLCSIERGIAKNDDEKRISIGWFPCSCLEKIE
ncbi:hypothetical protein ACHAXR_009516 [Thalassiosira sp. AJA248-18]